MGPRDSDGKNLVFRKQPRPVGGEPIKPKALHLSAA